MTQITYEDCAKTITVPN